jgi:hypothetical protein
MVPREAQKPNIRIINNNGISILVPGIEEKMAKVAMMGKDVINLQVVFQNANFTL